MDLDSFLHGRGFRETERPPLLWQADTTEATLAPLVSALIAAAAASGVTARHLTLNLSNVVVDPPEDGEEVGSGPVPGEYVALTLSGHVDLGPDDRWAPAHPDAAGLLRSLDARLAAANARFAYVRRLPPEGSVTVFFPVDRVREAGAAGGEERS